MIAEPAPSDEASGPRDPLEPVLRDVEDELQRRLREACDAEADGVSSESSAEIRRLEDALLAAAGAAKETLRIRDHIERHKAASREGAAPPPVRDQERGRERKLDIQSEVAAPELGQPPLSIREFRDAEGQLWRAWPVTPGRARAGSTAERYLGDYHKGWICFEAQEGSARRRLPQQLPQWSDLDDSELVRLLEQSISAPKRKPRPLNQA